jgi:hypothetical protein
MLEFRLIYQGLLQGADRDNSRSEHKHQIRRYIHKQLFTLWHTKEPLKSRTIPPQPPWAHRNRPADIERIAAQYQMGGKTFLPIMSSEWNLTCALDILILRRDDFPVITSGDLDNRIKTLLDALRIPKVGEFCDGEENPLYCLLEDDKLVGELKVTADLLLSTPEQVIENPRITPFGEYAANVNHTLTMMHVRVKRTGTGNTDFA